MENLQDLKPHSSEATDIIKKLQTDIHNGLSATEVTSRRQTYGSNVLEEQKDKSLFAILLDQVKSPVIYLLTAAAALSFTFGDIPEGIAIVVVILINAAIGFWMEFQARQSMKALRQMDKTEAKAIRDGQPTTIDAEDIVPGDILVLESGNLVAADARLVESSELQLNESSLTGESAPVEKNTAPVAEQTQAADRTNMVFKGTAVTMGKAKAVVTGTGMNTELGSISEMVSGADEESIPLNEKLQSLTKKLIWLVLIMAAALGGVTAVTGKELYAIIQTSIAWAIAAIPEGLPIVASIALAKGMLRLAKHNVVVKKLASVETLGETNIIFTDKTGTLTENRLTVEKIDLPGVEFDVKWDQNKKSVELSGDTGAAQESLEKLIRISVLCNDARFNENEEVKSEGDPLEIALLKFAGFFDKEKMKNLQKLERAGEDPFDSESKMMGTIHKDGKRYFVAAKGAAGAILANANRILERGEIKELSEKEKENWLTLNDELANKGLRTLAFAYKELDQMVANAEEFFLDRLVFVGVIGFIDPPQQDVKPAIMSCRDAGIHVAMVTGDHPGTAKNIALQVGLVDDDKAPVIHGSDLSQGKKTDEEIVETRIFSRVNPGQKYTLVERFQKRGLIVGMTGDGVNDAPALKKADIGIAMGLRGTQVAKEVADMVLKDDSFASIVKAVKQGRIIFSNIRKFIVYQLSYHFGEVLVIAAAAFTVFQLPLLPLQLLFLNILLDVFPALALGIGEGREGIMKDKPKPPDEPIVHKKSWHAVFTFGVIIAAAVSGAYFFGRFAWGLSYEVCNNIAFYALGFSQLIHTIDMRDHDEAIFNNQVTRNKYVWMAIVFGFLMLGLTYFVPGLAGLLSIQDLEMRIWLLIAAASVLPAVAIQIAKRFLKV